MTHSSTVGPQTVRKYKYHDGKRYYDLMLPNSVVGYISLFRSQDRLWRPLGVSRIHIVNVLPSLEEEGDVGVGFQTKRCRHPPPKMKDGVVEHSVR